jgi:hypothetical protein
MSIENVLREIESMKQIHFFKQQWTKDDSYDDICKDMEDVKKKMYIQHILVYDNTMNPFELEFLSLNELRYMYDKMKREMKKIKKQIV